MERSALCLAVERGQGGILVIAKIKIIRGGTYCQGFIPGHVSSLVLGFCFCFSTALHHTAEILLGIYVYVTFSAVFLFHKTVSSVKTETNPLFCHILVELSSLQERLSESYLLNE